MSTSDSDIPEPGTTQQLVARLARSAASAADTQDLSLSDTVARRVMNVTQGGSDQAADEARLQSLVGDVTRQVVVSKAALIEALLTSGLEPQLDVEQTVQQAPEPVQDGIFEAARLQLARLCDFIRSRLQHEEWFLFRRRYLEEASWAELAVDTGIVDEDGEPDVLKVRSRLGRHLETLRQEFDAAALDEVSAQSAALETGSGTAIDECPHATMLTWGLTEQQRRLAARSLPWVKLTAVDATRPALPLNEPLLVSAAQSDAYLTWATGAERTGRRVEPVIILLAEDSDRLPPRLWSYSNGTVTPNDWSRAEDLLNCSRLVETEAAAMSVEFQAASPDVVELRQQPIAEFSFEEDIASDTIAHVGSCVTCRVAFNEMLESRVQFLSAIPLSEVEVADLRAEQAATAFVEVESSSTAAEVSDPVEFPRELQDVWQESVPQGAQPVWLLLTVVAGFIGAEAVRTILSELKERGAARPEVLLAVFTRLLHELRRRSNRPRPPQSSLASFATDSVDDVLKQEPNRSQGVRSVSDRVLGSLFSIALGSAGLDDASRSDNTAREEDWNSAAHGFVDELTQGLRTQTREWSFILQVDAESGDLRIHSLENAQGQTVLDFEVVVSRQDEPPLRIASQSGQATLPIDDLASSLLDGCVTLTFQTK